MILAVLTALLAVVGVLALLPNLAATQLFTARPPQGERAMGLIVLSAAAAVAGVLLLLATATAAGTGGLNWAGRTTGPSVAIFAAIAIGMALGAVGCLINWCEPGGWPVFPIGAVSGFAGPALLAGVLIVSAFSPPGTIASPAVRTTLLVALAVASLVGYAVAGRWTLLGLRQSAENAQRSFQANAARDAEWDRKRNRTPMEAAREDFAGMADTTPLWCVVTYLEASDEPEYQQFVIARCRNVPDFESDLARTIASNHPRYRHPCLTLVAVAPGSAKTPAWAAAVGQSMAVTAEEIRGQPGWLTNASDANPKPLPHLQALIAAAARVAPHGELAAEAKRLRDAVVGHEPCPEKDAAITLIDAIPTH